MRRRLENSVMTLVRWYFFVFRLVRDKQGMRPRPENFILSLLFLFFRLVRDKKGMRCRLENSVITLVFCLSHWCGTRREV